MGAAAQVFKNNATEKIRLEAEQQERDRWVAQEKRDAMLNLANAFEASVVLASDIASAVEEQGVATQEIARNIDQAVADTHEVSANIGGVSQAANETGSGASDIQSTAAVLSRQSERLRAEVDKFLAGVRTA